MRNSLSRTKVKVCGMTQVSQVTELVNLSVDAIGVILHAESPRLINLEQAREIRKKIPAFISMVGVFVDCEIDMVNRYSGQIGLDLVQLHGSESEEYARGLTTPYIKAVRAKNADQVSQDIKEHSSARAVLLDPYVKGQHGGTGQKLDKNVWPTNYRNETQDQKLILAGGLSKENLLDSAVAYKPYAVDLNSGVELSPGVKDLQLVEACLAVLGR